MSEGTSADRSRTGSPWVCVYWIFVEQLFLVASLQVSRHLKGRPARYTSSPPRRPHPQPPLLHSRSMLGYPWAPDQTSKQTEQQKNPSPRRGWSGLGEVRRGGVGNGERSCLLSGPVPFHCDGRGGLPGHGYPHFCLTSRGDQGGPQCALTHHLLTQYTDGCSHGSSSLYLSWPCYSLLVVSAFI